MTTEQVAPAMAEYGLDDVLLRIRTHGWAIIPDVIPPGEVEAIRDDMARVYHEEGQPRVNYILNYLDHGAHTFSMHLSSPKVLEPVQSIFGGQHIRVRSNAGFYNPPGGGGGGSVVRPPASNLHADGPLLQQQPVRVAAPYPDATIQITTIWMLSDFSPQNGSTVIVTGSHRTATNPTALHAFRQTEAAAAAASAALGDITDVSQPDPQMVHSVGKAGDVLMFDNRCWHGTGTNVSDGPRIGLIMVYFPWWLCQDQNRPPGTIERERLKAETGLSDEELGPGTPLLPAAAFLRMADRTKPLVRHWLEVQPGTGAAAVGRL
eukprot:SAG22_NODE_2901_length_2115_cov_1.831349_2_plen_320_part_00